VRKCHRFRHRGRPPVFGRVEEAPPAVVYVPVAGAEVEAVELCQDEVEAIKLAHLEGLSVEEIAQRLGVSAATAWRILESGRRKIAEALALGKPFKIVRKA